jgi:hypothetical protein
MQDELDSEAAGAFSEKGAKRRGSRKSGRRELIDGHRVPTR